MRIGHPNFAGRLQRRLRVQRASEPCCPASRPACGFIWTVEGQIHRVGGCGLVKSANAPVLNAVERLTPTLQRPLPATVNNYINNKYIAPNNGGKTISTT